MHKAIFLDKDGTLIKDVPYNVKPELITLEDSCIEGLQALQRKGFLLVIVSNQAGVAHGFFKEEELSGVKDRIESLLGGHSVYLDGFYYCPNHPEGALERYRLNCGNRKPAPGMLLQAAEDFRIDLSASWMLGDILHDVEAGNRAGCKSILINNGNETEWLWNEFNHPQFTATNINQAAEFILNSQA